MKREPMFMWSEAEYLNEKSPTRRHASMKAWFKKQLGKRFRRRNKDVIQEGMREFNEATLD
mgnify:CR=1 FL=1|tara:strand:+ start:191 stop:373 length:183 start_codon:yes stop_codon:yes gene_type:complete